MERELIYSWTGNARSLSPGTPGRLVSLLAEITAAEFMTCSLRSPIPWVTSRVSFFTDGLRLD